MSSPDPAIPRDTVELFKAIGRDLFVSGLITSHGGNMSVRFGDSIVITRRGSMLGRLADSDVVRTLLEPCNNDARCSREIVVHRAIYEATDALAVVHAHPPHTIWRSMIADEIVPIDSEGLYITGTVPVVEAAQTIASLEAGALLADALADRSIAVLRTHGPFARGTTLEEAYGAVSCLEASCKILDIRDRAAR